MNEQIFKIAILAMTAAGAPGQDAPQLPDWPQFVSTIQPDKKDKTNEARSANESFIQAANQINLAEMKLGKTAQDHALSMVVKKFGERTVLDHSRMNKELREIASKKGFALGDKLDAKHQELLDELSRLKGAAFDQAYTKDMVAGHEAAIKHFESEAKNGRDPDVKAWAEKCLPTLREHLKLAQAAVLDVKGK